jgi:hypothetical protein
LFGIDPGRARSIEALNPRLQNGLPNRETLRFGRGSNLPSSRLWEDRRA